MSVLSLPDEGLAPWTKGAQLGIFRWQFRSATECAKAKFLATTFRSGVGSEWHVATAFLTSAMNEGRIFVWGQRGDSSHYMPASLCGNDTSWECYLRSPTNCTAYMTKDNTRIVDGGADQNVPSWALEGLRAASPKMTSNEQIFWWRAQAVAVLTRPNSRTLAAVRRLRQWGNMTRLAVGPTAAQPALVYPLPPGTISTHVRHGDKFIESTLIGWGNYSAAAVALQAQNPLRVTKNLFLSTEDAAVISEAATQPGGAWSAFFSDIPRENNNGYTQMKLADNMMHLHLLQLYMTLECDAWIGTLASNWNRLISELRCVWLPKCGAPYIELGPEREWISYCY